MLRAAGSLPAGLAQHQQPIGEEAAERAALAKLAWEGRRALLGPGLAEVPARKINASDSEVSNEVNRISRSETLMSRAFHLFSGAEAKRPNCRHTSLTTLLNSLLLQKFPTAVSQHLLR